jgi:predicted murein hydrolase (TIGR00659 family)
MLSMMGLVMTVAVFAVAKRVYKRIPLLFLSPLLVVPTTLVVILSTTDITYGEYLAGAKWISSLLGPATVAFAIPIYKNLPLLRRYALEIGLSAVLGSATALLSSVLPALWLHLSPETATSLAPRSVTTPVAMDISRSIGGVPTMTAVFVIVTALVGVMAGPALIRWLQIRTPVARGALFGTGAHAAGTARAFEFGDVEGTVASLSMIAAAGATLVLTPVLWPLIGG